MADFYGTFAGFQAYWLARGTAVTAYLQPAVEAALLVASEYLDMSYRNGFSGRKIGLRAQVREWPRSGATDINWYPIPVDAVPIECEYATYEIALRQLQAPGSLLTDGVNGALIKSASVDGAVSVTYANVSGIDDMQLSIPAVERIMAALMTASRVSSLSHSTTLV